MKQALLEAQIAYEEGEIPIGAVVVRGSDIIGKAHNMVEQKKDTTAHAELLALKAASNKINEKFLDNCDLYVTVEPCLMCSGAIINSRISNLYFGIFEPKTGACGTVYNSFENKSIPRIYSGVLGEESRIAMRKFFNNLRK